MERIIEKKGAAALEDEAFIATTHFENKRNTIEDNREAITRDQQQKDLEFQSEIKSLITSQKDVFSVPVEQGTNDKFSEWFFGGGLGKALSNPKDLVDISRFIYEKNTILKTVAQKAMEKGEDKGYEKAKKDYEAKIFGKDARDKTNISRGEQKRQPAKNGTFDPAKFIANVVSGGQRP